MINKYSEKCSMALAIREMHVKTHALRYAKEFREGNEGKKWKPHPKETTEPPVPKDL